MSPALSCGFPKVPDEPFARRNWGRGAAEGFRLRAIGAAPVCLLVGLLGAGQLAPVARAVPEAPAAKQRTVLILGRGEPFREPGNIPTHPQMAKATFLKLAGNPQNDPAKGWTADLSWDVMVRLGLDPTNTPPEVLFNYIGQHHLGYRIVIQNFAGGASDGYWGSAVDNGLMPFAPHFNNTPNLYVPDVIGLKAAVSVGGGVGQNYYSYGPGLEFYDALPLWASANGFEDAAESWANQALAIKFAHLLDAHPDYNVWDAREHLRQAGSHWAAGWTEKQGYGRVNEHAVVGKLLPGPPVAFVAMPSRDRRQVLFAWRNFLMTDFAATVIARRDGRVLYDGAGTNFVWTSDVDGDATFTYWSRNLAGEKSRMESYQTITVKDLVSQPNSRCLVLGATASYPGLSGTLRVAFLRNAPDWVCDRVDRPGLPPGRTPKSVPASDVVSVLPDFHAMAGYAIANHYRLLVAPASYDDEDDLFQFKDDWDRATAAGVLVVLGHYYQVPGRTPEQRLPVPPRLYSAVTVGIAGLPNTRSVGPGLEFIDIAPPDSFVVQQALPSVVAAKVAGKLARLLEAHRNYNLWDARQHLRQSASHYAAGWTEDGGYGRPPDQPATLGSLDPAPPLDLQVVKSADGKSVTFSWMNFLQTSFAETVIQRNDGRVIYHGAGNRFVWPSDVDGDETFRFFSKAKSGRLSRPETYTVFPVTGLVKN